VRFPGESAVEVFEAQRAAGSEDFDHAVHTSFGELSDSPSKM
jgi:hypothetical protein